MNLGLGRVAMAPSFYMLRDIKLGVSPVAVGLGRLRCVGESIIGGDRSPNFITTPGLQAATCGARFFVGHLRRRCFRRRDDPQRLDLFATVEALAVRTELNRLGELAGFDQTLAMFLTEKATLIEVSLTEKFLHGDLRSLRRSDMPRLLAG